MADEVLPESERKQWVKFSEKGAPGEAVAAGSAPTSPADTATASPAPSPYSSRSATAADIVQVSRADQHFGSSLKESTSLQDVSLDEVAVVVDCQSSADVTTSRQRHQPSNGDVIVSLLPLNTRFPWITPAQFRPELVPEELMADHLTLTVEEYVEAMELLVHDVRFNIYNVFYKRILILWLTLGFAILLVILFTARPGLQLFGAGVLWLVINAVTIFFCMYAKIKMNRELERCVAMVNRVFVRHNILLGVDDRGHLSCHKVNLCFIYFNTKPCMDHLADVVAKYQPSGECDPAASARRRRLDIDHSDIIITGARNTRISRQQERCERVLLRYSQRWCKDYLRKRLDWTVNMSERLEVAGGAAGGATAATTNGATNGSAASGVACVRHLSTARCPCQYIEDHLSWKPSSALADVTCCGLQPPEFCSQLLL